MRQVSLAPHQDLIEEISDHDAPAFCENSLSNGEPDARCATSYQNYLPHSSLLYSQNDRITIAARYKARDGVGDIRAGQPLAMPAQVCANPSSDRTPRDASSSFTAFLVILP